MWKAVDDYIDQNLVQQDEALVEALRRSEAAGLPAIQVSPSQGKLLHLLARSVGARRILEIGTLGGYSAIWLARALPPDGRLVSLELEPAHAEVARRNLRHAGVGDAAEVRVGRALDLLPQLHGEGGPPFDLAFIDADKPSNADYFEWALRMSRPGGLIVVDNVVREGSVVDPSSRDEAVQGVRRVVELMGQESRISATAVQTVGGKGYDGFAVALVL